MKKDFKNLRHNPSNIIIIYSKNHFDPNNANTLSTHSAGGLARNIFLALKNLNHSIVYIDQNEKPNYDIDPDLILGIVSKSFIKLSQRFPSAMKVLFLVNSHPLYRDKVLLKESALLNKKIPKHEWINPLIFFKAQKYADKIILIGNNFVKQTYLNYNIEPEKLFLINSGVDLERLTPDSSKQIQGQMNILYSASDLGLRKGLFRVIRAWAYLNRHTGSGAFKLFIIGGDDSFKQEIQAFINEHENTTYLGWIDSSTEKYRNILQSMNVILFPSLEEGQVGTVLEAMACGCIPVITEQCGIPITDNKDGFIINDYQNPQEITDHLFKLNNSKELLQKMSVQARIYVEKNHNWTNFQQQIQKIVNA